MSISRINTPPSYEATLPDVFEVPPPPSSPWEQAVQAIDREDLLALRKGLQETFKDLDSLPNFESWEKEANSLLSKPSLSDPQKAIFDSLLAYGILKTGTQFDHDSSLDSRSDLLTWIKEKIPSDSSYVGPETLTLATISSISSENLLHLLFEKCSQQTKEKILPEAFFISIKFASKISKWEWIKKPFALAKEHSIKIEKNLLLSSLLLTTKPKPNPRIEREILHHLLSLMEFPSLFSLFEDYFSPSYLDFSRTFHAAFEKGSMLSFPDDIRHSLFLGSLTDRDESNLSTYRISHFISLLNYFYAVEADKDELLREKYLSAEAFSAFLETGKNSQWKNEVEEIFQSPDFISRRDNLETRDTQRRQNRPVSRINYLKKSEELAQESISTIARGKRKSPSHKDDPEDDPEIVMEIRRGPHLKRGKTAVSSAAFPFIQVETVKDGNCLPHAIALEFLRRGSIPSTINGPERTTLLEQLQAGDVEGLKKSIRDLGASAIEGPESNDSLTQLISAILEDWEQESLHSSKLLTKFPLVPDRLRNRILNSKLNVNEYSDREKTVISYLYTVYQLDGASKLQSELSMEDKIKFLLTDLEEEAAKIPRRFSSISQELRETMLRVQYTCNNYTDLEKTEIWQAYVEHAKTDKAFLDLPFIKGLNTLGIPVEVLSKSPLGQKVVLYEATPQQGYDKISVYRPSNEHHYYGLIPE